METTKLGQSTHFFTLTQFLMDLTNDKELTILMGTLALACKATSRACAHASIAGLLGQAESANASGDDQKKLDVLSNDIFVNALMNSHTCAVLVSEENDDPIIVDEDKAGSFCVAFDPLDGSSNIDCNVCCHPANRLTVGIVGEHRDHFRCLQERNPRARIYC